MKYNNKRLNAFAVERTSSEGAFVRGVSVALACLIF